MSQFETIRHGDKNAEGGLSEKGKEQSQGKAHELYEQITNAPNGAVIYITPSNVERAIETRDEIELKLKELCANQENIEFISVHDIERIKEAKENLSKKFVITDLQPQSLIGFKPETSYIPAWKEYGKKFSGNEYYIMLAWATIPNEIESVRHELKGIFTDIDSEQINPSDFIQTPEEEAIKYLRLSRRMGEITKKYFPDHPYRNIQVGHNVADFAVLALMGEEISATNLKKVLNSESRSFLESAMFEEKDGKIIVKYRDNETEQEKSLEEIIKELEVKSVERRNGWVNRSAD